MSRLAAVVDVRLAAVVDVRQRATAGFTDSEITIGQNVLHA